MITVLEHFLIHFFLLIVRRILEVPIIPLKVENKPRRRNHHAVHLKFPVLTNLIAAGMLFSTSWTVPAAM